MSEHFRRTDPRYDRRLDVDLILDGQRHTVVSKNVSLGGILVEAVLALPVGSIVQVQFRVPSQPEIIEVAGEIRWVEGGGAGKVYGMGVCFQGLRARDVWALNRFFQT